MFYFFNPFYHHNSPFSLGFFFLFFFVFFFLPPPVGGGLPETASHVQFMDLKKELNVTRLDCGNAAQSSQPQSAPDAGVDFTFTEKTSHVIRV